MVIVPIAWGGEEEEEGEASCKGAKRASSELRGRATGVGSESNAPLLVSLAVLLVKSAGFVALLFVSLVRLLSV